MLSKCLYQVLAGKRSITADTALRLGQYFGMSADFWMNLQTAYDLDLARQQSGTTIHRLPTRSGAQTGVRQQSRKLRTVATAALLA